MQKRTLVSQVTAYELWTSFRQTRPWTAHVMLQWIAGAAHMIMRIKRCLVSNLSGNRRCGVRLFRDPYNPDSEAMKFPCPFPGCTYRTLQAGNLKPHSLKQCGPSMSDSVNVHGAFIGDSIDFFVPSASLELLEGHPTDVFYGSHTAQDLSNHSAVPSQVNGKLKESYQPRRLRWGG
ncbi:hypothetical protein BKA93DRAFT_479286 [Sparassis latifolia]